jgi:O-methyltransferase
MSPLKLLLRIHYALDAPFSIFALVNSGLVHPAYRMGLWRRMALGFRMLYNTLRVPTATSYKSHLAMAMKLLEMPPETKGDVAECGTWLGGSAVNLSLVCRIVGRKLLVHDSFEGLPEPVRGDREGRHYKKGDYCGPLETVQRNVARYGAPEACVYVRGWYDDTLPELNQPLVLAFVDVDLEASLDTCVRCIWPHLDERGFLFIDEAVTLDYVSLFFSERWWQRHFQRTPPGLFGAGSGLPLGDVFVGPYGHVGSHPLWLPHGVGYAAKSGSAVWTFEPAGGGNREPVAG